MTHQPTLIPAVLVPKLNLKLLVYLLMTLFPIYSIFTDTSIMFTIVIAAISIASIIEAIQRFKAVDIEK